VLTISLTIRGGGLPQICDERPGWAMGAPGIEPGRGDLDPGRLEATPRAICRVIRGRVV